MKNCFENLGDMKKMQQDSIAKANEMNIQSQKNYSGTSNKNTNCDDNKNEKHKTFEEKVHCKSNSTHKKETSNTLNILDALLNDPEKSLVLILIFLFLDEDTNPILILALAYLLM